MLHSSVISSSTDEHTAGMAMRTCVAVQVGGVDFATDGHRHARDGDLVILGAPSALALPLRRCSRSCRRRGRGRRFVVSLMRGCRGVRRGGAVAAERSAAAAAAVRRVVRGPAPATLGAHRGVVCARDPRAAVHVGFVGPWAVSQKGQRRSRRGEAPSVRRPRRRPRDGCIHSSVLR